MTVLDVHILVQTILYLAAFLAGLAICIPIGVSRDVFLLGVLFYHHMMNFNGKCILYADFKWITRSFFTMTSGQAINCNFPIYFSVFGLICYGLGLGIYNGYAVIKSKSDKSTGFQMYVMPFILLNTFVGSATFVMACMISVGFKRFCDGLTESGHYKTCYAAEGERWSDWDFDSRKMYDTGPYYKLFNVAQIAGWVCFLIWVLQVAMCILRFVKNRRQRSAQMFDAAQKSHTATDTDKIAELSPTI